VHINNQQKINTAVYIHRTSTSISYVGPKLLYLNVMSNECTTHKQQHNKCSHRLAKMAQTMQNKCTPGNIHTTNNCFTALLDSAWDYPGEPAPKR